MNPHILMFNATDVLRYAWPGGYPVFHVTNDGAALCTDCVQAEMEQCSDPNAHGWYVVGHDVNWEDPELFCDHCNARIESAYAERD